MESQNGSVPASGDSLPSPLGTATTTKQLPYPLFVLIGVVFLLILIVNALQGMRMLFSRTIPLDPPTELQSVVTSPNNEFHSHSFSSTNVRERSSRFATRTAVASSPSYLPTIASNHQTTPQTRPSTAPATCNNTSNTGLQHIASPIESQVAPVSPTTRNTTEPGTSRARTEDGNAAASCLKTRPLFCKI
ncbi:hypothetical protein ONS95_008392 [Cadophora gregata]|uniref:uncharacterized protein n=1 Tax=Cadophora gregata TaxID=51156 RepID=UPI0026DCDD43|nr:uncharacterized protein ONS95_008392 [Cadophora gregata]KAK0126813.1 hypothetical protein ONS95_008392 [Cadophora gregata]